MKNDIPTHGSARVHLIRGAALALAAGVLLTGCAQKGPTSTSETVEGSSYGGGSTTDPGTGGIDPTTDPTTAPSTGGTTSPDMSSGGELVKFTVNGQDYSTVSPYSCSYTAGMVVSTGGDSAGNDPSFSVMFSEGQDDAPLITVSTSDFFGLAGAESTTLKVSYDQSTATYTVSGTVADMGGGKTAPIEISGTCK